ncbi:MAG TPA: YciI family protein [Myxococcota bacterium]|nr:YciI family protein [Thermoleophilaceae bacterium]HZO08142.1 YciI family protein [Myxococcota bacterium]
MRYLLNIYADERVWTDATPEQQIATMEAYGAFGEEAGDRIVAGEGLEPTTTATTVRVRDGERLLSDGPFAETKEQLGGFYLVECENLDEALALAAKIPDAATGCVEVRPVLDYEALGAPDEQGARQGAAS